MMQLISEMMPVRLPRFSLACAAALAAALIGVVSPARAGFTTYFGIDQGNGTPPTTPVNSLALRNSFVAALSGVGVENFGDQTVGVLPTTLNFPPTSVTAAVSSTDPSGNYVTTGTPNGTFAINGTNFLYTPGNGTSYLNVNLVFSTPIAGFGLYATDLSDGAANTTADNLQFLVTLTNNSTQTFTTNVLQDNNNANVLFFGVVSSDPSQMIKSILITNTNPDQGGGDAVGLDDFTLGQATVPEPASLGMVALGLGAVLAVRRYSRRPGGRPRN